MDFSLAMEERMLQESAERFCRNEYSFPLRRERLVSGRSIDRERWLDFAELGWLGAALPAGPGSTQHLTNLALLMQEFGKALVVEPFLTVVIAAQVIDLCGAPEQRANLLEALARGQLLLALAHNELNTSARVAAVETTARQTASGYVINGVKALVLDGPSVDGFLVSARTAGTVGTAEGVSLLHVPRGLRALTEHDYDLLDGFRACDLHFESVEVGAEALIGKLGGAAPAIEAAMDVGALGIAAEAVGAMDAVVALTTDYLKSRRQYGTFLSTLQALQHRVADLIVETELSRSVLYRALSSFSSSDVVARQSNVSACKAHIGHSGRLVAANGLQLHGALGFSNEYKMGHYFKRLTAIASLFGDTDFHLNRYIDLRTNT